MSRYEAIQTLEAASDTQPRTTKEDWDLQSEAEQNRYISWLRAQSPHTGTFVVPPTELLTYGSYSQKR